MFAEKEEDGRIAIDFPANHDGFTDLSEVDGRWEKTIKAVLQAAPSLDEEDIVNVAWVPLGPIVELKTSVDLKKLRVDVSDFASPRYRCLIIRAELNSLSSPAHSITKNDYLHSSCAFLRSFRHTVSRLCSRHGL